MFGGIVHASHKENCCRFEKPGLTKNGSFMTAHGSSPTRCFYKKNLIYALLFRYENNFKSHLCLIITPLCLPMNTHPRLGNLPRFFVAFYCYLLFKVHSFIIISDEQTLQPATCVSFVYLTASITTPTHSTRVQARSKRQLF